MLRYEDVKEKTIADIYTDGVFRLIHFLAYGYFAEDNGSGDHRFVEYTFFVAPLSEVLDMGISEYESEYGCEYKQYVTDCNKEKMMYLYEHYNDGSCPKPLPKCELNINTPDGMYVLV